MLYRPVEKWQLVPSSICQSQRESSDMHVHRHHSSCTDLVNNCLYRVGPQTHIVMHAGVESCPRAHPGEALSRGASAVLGQVGQEPTGGLTQSSCCEKSIWATAQANDGVLQHSCITVIMGPCGCSAHRILWCVQEFASCKAAAGHQPCMHDMLLKQMY